MKRTIFYSFVSLFAFAAVITACNGNGNKNDRTDTPTSGAITFASDESFSPIIEEERKQFEFLYPKAKLTPIYTNDIDGFKMLLDSAKRDVPIYFSSRRLKQGEEYFCETIIDIKAKTFPIGYDGIAFIVNRQNNDTCISVKDVKRVLSGEAKQWKDIYPDSKLGDIEVVFDNKQSATLHYCVDSILGGKPIDSDNVVAAKTSKEVISYVEKTPNAIGVIGSNWLMDKRDPTNTTFVMNVHVMSVSISDQARPGNSKKPFQYYLLTAEYPFVRAIYAIMVDTGFGLPRGFIDYITGPKGQLIVNRAGLLPYRGDLTLKKLDVKRK